ncbi:MAG: AAA family ATPase [Desulfococcaceae bacterium]|nr:AAA family ATPase [Desulfococcaceae bacterium]
MNICNERIPDPKEIERELGEFLAKKFGGEVKIISPMTMPRKTEMENVKIPEEKKRINFDLKPADLISYLDQYIVRQDQAKAVLSTKICTHFNRIKYSESSGNDTDNPVGRIKNNVLMIGPTGVGKTYIIRLIAKKIGVPFVKGDATKFSETGYVGGDVEDLIRDLVREADEDIDLARYGIIYIDEIDKIASSRNMIGADVSRTGVQRALLKPMEETDVELKVPHDPISMIQEIERFRKTGKREKRVVNTRNILFIMSGAFGELPEIITRRMSSRAIGFGSSLKNSRNPDEIFRHVRSEDLIEFGFESEFVGRLPVHTILERLSEKDLFEILENPNNPVILGKKLDFAAYGIRIRFHEKALRLLAKQAWQENTGARGLVSAVERALLPFERTLPSTGIKILPVTEALIEDPEKALEMLLENPDDSKIRNSYEKLMAEEKEFIRAYISSDKSRLLEKYNLSLTPSRLEIASDYYCRHTQDVESVIRKIRHYADEIKNMELFFYKNHDINIVMEDDAVDYMIEQVLHSDINIDQLYKKLNLDFEYGLKLLRQKTGKNRFFITREALTNPEAYVGNLLKDE